MKLEPGTIEALYRNQTDNPLYKSPVLQIISLAQMPMVVSDKIRYKANLSDGAFHMRGVFSADIGQLIQKGTISLYTLVKLSIFSVKSKDENHYLYIQGLHSYENCNREFGNSVSISSGRTSFTECSSKASSENVRNSPAAEHVRNERHGRSGGCDRNGGSFNPPVAEQNLSQQKMKNGTLENNEKRPRLSNKDEKYTPIKSINPFYSKWIIKGRVISKSDIRHFTNQKGEGKLFSFDVTDGTATIKVTAFSECVDIFYPIIEHGSVFTISKGLIKMSNKQFNNTNFDYEISLDKNSEIERLGDDDAPKYSFNFVKIHDLAVGMHMPDVIGIIKEAFPASTIVIRSTQKESLKRDLILIDDTGSIRVTLWGSKAEIDMEAGKVLALRSAKVGEFNGITLSTVGSTQLILNPDISESHELIGWYEKYGKDIKVNLPQRAEKRRFIQEVKDYELEYSLIQANIMFIKEDNLWYESCIEENCNKKVSIEDGDRYRCEKCNKTYDRCNYRYMANMHVGDFTGQIWVSMFDEAATSLFGVSSAELKALGESNSSQLQNLVKGVCYKEVFLKIKAKQENYNNELRTKYSVLSMQPFDLVKETAKLITVVEKIVG